MFSLFGLLLGIFNYEYGVYLIKDALDPEKYEDPMHDPRNLNIVSQICRLGITSTSILACIFLYQRQKYKKEWVTRFMCGDRGNDR